jgi:hypothetical protein
LFALLFTFDSGSFWGLLGDSTVVGAALGAATGVLSRYLSRGQRDFASQAQTRACHYEVQVEDAYAAEAQRVLSSMPAN